jgi:hypothetical protein
MHFSTFLDIFGHFWTFLGDFWKNSFSGIACNVAGSCDIVDMFLIHFEVEVTVKKDYFNPGKH